MARVLIADDRAEDRELYRTVLEAAGHEICEAGNGEEALQQARLAPPDLLIADILMPRMDGFQLAREWAADPHLRRIPFFFCSANYLHPLDLALANDLGAGRILVKPIDAASLRAAVEAVLQGETTTAAASAAQLLREAEFQARHAEAMSRQMDQKMRALEAANLRLAMQEQSFRLLFEANPHPMWVYARDTLEFLTVNDAALRHYGYSREEFLAMTLADLVPAEDVAAIQRTLESHRDRPTQSRVWRFRKRCGEIRLAEASSHPIDFLGRPGRLALAVDVTDRIRSEEALRMSEERFRLLSRATADAVWDWNVRTDAVWWNEGFEKLFGYRRDEIESDSRSWSTRIHDEDRDEVLQDVTRSLEQDRDAWVRTYRFRRADGQYAVVRDRGFIIRDETGRAVRMLGGMTDVTERLALEEQLRQAQRLESVGKLTGGIAHDFNNLLTVILGGGELLVARLEHDPENAELAKIIVAAAERGAELTRRLLAFARRQALQPQTVDVNTLVTGMAPLLRRTLGDHIEISLALQPDLGAALVDPTQLENALLNLCINARDAMPEGGRLALETARTVLTPDQGELQPDVAPGEYVVVSVTDTGTGIAAEHLPHLFEPFFTTKEQGKGTGLGLAMVYGFAMQSRGQVLVESEPGCGATFRLYLPCALGTAPAADLAAPQPRAAPATGATVLLVDDDLLVRRNAAEQLARLGYRVIVAGDAAEALQTLREGRAVDLLLTDVVMPGSINGRQLAEEALRLRPGLPVLYSSGYAQDVIVHEGQLEANVRLLRKPYRQAELAEAVRRALGQ